MKLLAPALIALCASAASARVPLTFETNHGQAPEYVQYLARWNGSCIGLTGTEALFTFRDGAIVRMQWLGANADARGEGLEPLPGRSNYFLGSDPKGWRTDIPHFARVEYRDLYPGVNLVYYGVPGKIEYDLVVAPGADPRQIRLAFPGAKVRLTRAGELVVRAGSREIRHERPLVYQEVSGGRRRVDGRYRLSAGGRVGFEVAAYDRSRALVIDPTVVNYATYLGGMLEDQARAITVDSSGNAYVTGWTFSPNFPATPAGVLQPSLNGVVADAFVTKFSPTGDRILFSTYLGGAGPDNAYGIALDAAGNIYVAGETGSGAFPVTTGSFQQTLRGGSGISDGFVTKLNPSGSAMIYSTYFGGVGHDFIRAIAVDAAGHAYVTGQTQSGALPVQNPLQERPAGGGDAFFTKFTPDGSGLVYSTYFGGTGGENGLGIAVDGTGAAYVTGFTRSTNFPFTANTIQTMQGGSADVMIVKVNPAGSAIVYALALGGSGADEGNGIAIDAAGSAYVVGNTDSFAYPITLTGFQPIVQQSPDAFVTKINPAGTAMVYSGFLGGRGGDFGQGVAVDAAGNTWAIGRTDSGNFPTVEALPFPRGGFDAFLTRINAAGDTITFSTFIGGIADEVAYGVAVDALGNAYVAGVTASMNFPATAGAAMVSPGGGMSDAFVIKIGEPGSIPAPIMVTVSPASVALTNSQTQQFTAMVTGTLNTAVTWSRTPAVGAISATGLYTAPAGILTEQIVTVTATSVADMIRSASATVRLIPLVVSVTVNPNAATLRASQTQQFTATVSNAANTAVNWSISPNVGSISTTGLYTAPSFVSAQQVVTVTATSVADATKSASAFVTLVLVAPAITQQGIANAASFISSLLSGGVAPGEILVFYGTRMGPRDLVNLQLTPAGFISTLLADTRVLFDDVAAPLIYVSEGQIACIVPYSVASRSNTNIQVEYLGVRSNTVSMPVAPSSPGIFTANQAGTEQAAAFNQDASPNAPSNPAGKETIMVLFATGEGQTNPSGVDGKPATVPLPRPTLPVDVFFGGVRATEILYAGGAPGLTAGLLQLNVVIPAGAPSGNVAIRVRIGESMSQGGVTVAIR